MRTTPTVQLANVVLASGPQAVTYWQHALAAAGYTSLKEQGPRGNVTITFVGHGDVRGTGLNVSGGGATLRFVTS